jgi:hypothetical protein
MLCLSGKWQFVLDVLVVGICVLVYNPKPCYILVNLWAMRYPRSVMFFLDLVFTFY